MSWENSCAFTYVHVVYVSCNDVPNSQKNYALNYTVCARVCVCVCVCVCVQH